MKVRKHKQSKRCIHQRSRLGPAMAVMSLIDSEIIKKLVEAEQEILHRQFIEGEPRDSEPVGLLNA